jgi:hypothetical protein
MVYWTFLFSLVTWINVLETCSGMNTINTGMSEIRVLKYLNYYVFCDTIFFLFTAKDKLFNSICDEMDNAKANMKVGG